MNFKIPFEILLLTSSVGVLQSAFFGFYLLSFKKGNRTANKLLAFLLLAFAIRVGKSVSYYFAEGNHIPQLFENFGYAAHTAITPLLWLYLNAYLKKDYTIHWLKDGVHLSPFVLIVLLSPFLNSHFWLGQGGYTYSLYLMVAYLPFCFYIVSLYYKNLNKKERLWILSLVIGVSLVWAAYIANYLLGVVSYISAAVIFSFVTYFMSYLGLKQNGIFVQETKYRNSAFTAAEIEQCFIKLQELMIKEKPYKDVLLTLPKLAKQIGTWPNLLSQAINEKGKQNFPDYINSYRVKEAQVLLADSNNANQKISSLAFDAGFNTLSAFNTAFKKFTQSTPSEYRKKTFAN